MDDFPGLLARDFGFKPQGKSAPMAPSRNSNLSANSSSSSFGLGSNASEFTKSSSLKSNAIFDDHDQDGLLFNDVFGGPPKYSSTSAVDSRSGSGNTSSFDYDSIFRDQNAKSQNSKSNSVPVFDKPVYDDDIFEGLPGLKSSSATAAKFASPREKFDDVFSSISGSPPKQRSVRESSPFDDLLGNLGKKEIESGVKPEKDASAFDDLLPGFGRSSSPNGNRSTSESSWSQKPPSNSGRTASSAMDDPFVVLESTSTPEGSSSEVLTDPLEEIGKFGGSGSAKVNGSPISGGVFDDLDPLTSFGKSVPPVSPEVNKRGKDGCAIRSKSTGGMQTHLHKESIESSSVEHSDGYVQNRTTVDGFQGSNETFFDMRSVSTDSHSSAGRATSPPSYMSASPSENSQDPTPKGEEIFESTEDVWLTVSKIPLFTQPTSAPPPSRPPPPRPTRVFKSDNGSGNARKKANEYSSSVSNSSQYAHSPKSAHAAARSPVPSQIDELEDFAMGHSWNNVNEYGEVPSGDDVDNSVAAASAAAMKEAMDRAEAKFRHAKEMRERESLKAARSREPVQLDKDERSILDAQEKELRERQERLYRERLQRQKEEEEQRRLEREEEKEREQRRLEKERERAREIEKEREKARQAVERATREARERAAAEARMKAERAAVDKVNAAARERAERAAVQRAQAEARERAAAVARERAERSAAEARERATTEAMEKEACERAAAARAAERAAVERAAAEARERAAAEAARANQNQQKNDNDLESFFSMNSRPSSAPRPRANSSDPLFDAQSKGPEPARRTSVGVSSHMKKASSTTNIVDDLSSIFGAAGSSAGEFQDVEGETEERRRARLERHQRTQERAAKALAEKNQRDLQAQREQAERHRIAETLDAEIKRWAAGKEGSIRALLATLQYVLWPECGWQPVSLTDLITAAAVKKVYRKATLCIHPDKVQQKGANLQQKYIAEKVFDLLKEAWNKFNSEELF